jgi:glycosyltransferase involved in cell wall biosynthesis
MRIAILPDEYMPSGKRIHAKMLHELAQELQKNGHKVIVITPGDPYQKEKLDISFFEGIEIWRFRSGHTRGVGMFWRLINEFMLSFRAWQAISIKVNENPFDLCINYSPTIFFGPLARKLKQKGAFVYLILRDMFPQWAVDRGLLSKFSPILYFFRIFESLNYKISDWIGVQSEMNKVIFCDRYPNLKNVSVLMNWGANTSTFNTKASMDVRVHNNLTEKIIFFYGGNIGHAQDMTNIMRLALNLKSHSKAHFLIIGQGDEYHLINKLKIDWSLDNVTILPSVSQSEFMNFLGTSDVGLFSLSRDHTAHNFPGKILGYMSASLPILGSVNPGNDLLPLINNSNSGFVYINGDDSSFKNAALKLARDNDLRENQGSNANSLLKNCFSIESAELAIVSKVNRAMR